MNSRALYTYIVPNTTLTSGTKRSTTLRSDSTTRAPSPPNRNRTSVRRKRKRVYTSTARLRTTLWSSYFSTRTVVVMPHPA